MENTAHTSHTLQGADSENRVLPTQFAIQIWMYLQWTAGNLAVFLVGTWLNVMWGSLVVIIYPH